MAIGSPYKQVKPAERWDAIVIGSGIGGLTAAVLLAVHGGKRVLVLERHYEAGGFTHTFHRPGYEWDVGLHYIGQVQDEGDIVVTVCDMAREELGGAAAVHWSVPDPVPAGDPTSFDAAVAELSGRVERLAPRLAATS